MTLNEAMKILEKIPNVPIKQLFPEEELLDIKINKGKIGQLVEKITLKLKLSSNHLDFSNGELKTNKCKANGSPAETLAICMASSIIDELNDINLNPINNYVMEKINNWIYMGINKANTNDPTTWSFFKPIHVSRNNPKFNNWYKKLDEDFYFIRQHLYNCCNSNKMISSTTSVGKYIQIRTKGAGHGKGAIFSKRYNRYVSDKSYGIYLTLDGIKALQKIGEEK